MSTGVSKIASQRNHRVLLELTLKPGNDVCADCKARAPRWASHNLGIFICVGCASIHRKIGTHVTKVKSITLDEWTKEQVEVMKEKGNIRSNALYNPNEARHPPPTNMMDSERDSELEKFIRSKYEFKRFMDRKSGIASQHLSAEPRGASLRSRSTPLTDAATIERRASPGPPPPPKTPENLPPGLRYSLTVPSLMTLAQPPARSVSQPLPLWSNAEKLSAAPALRHSAATQPSMQKPAGQVWDDLISLQGPSQSSSLPLQYSPAAPIGPFPSQPQVLAPQQPGTPGINAPNPFLNLSLGQTHATAPLVTSPVSISTPAQQFLFAPQAPLSSPAIHLGATNPFNQAFAAHAASMNGTSFPTSTNPFSSAMTLSAPATPLVQPVMGLPTGPGAMLPTPPLGYITSQPTASTPALSFSPAPFSVPANTTGLVQHPFTPQVPLTTGVSTNPFAAMQMGQVAFMGTTPPTASGVLGAQQAQQQPHPSQLGFGAWAGQGVQRTF